MPAQALTFELRGLPTLWLLVTSLGWALVPLTPLQTTFRTYAEVARQLPVYALVGLLLGAATGLGQALVLRQKGCLDWRWWLASAVGFALALPLALVVVTLIPSFFFAARGANPWFLPLTKPGGTFFMPLPQVLALCGGVVGAVQWLALRRLLPRSRLAMALLWVFGAWASLSIGLVIGELARTLALGFGWTGVMRGLFGRAAAGAAIGLLTGTLLIILMREARRLGELPGSGPAPGAVRPHVFLAGLLGALLVAAAIPAARNDPPGQDPPQPAPAQATPGVGPFVSSGQPVNVAQPAGYAVGWGTLSLINAGLAQGKNRSGANWFLASLLLGPLATLLLVISPNLPAPGGPARP